VGPYAKSLLRVRSVPNAGFGVRREYEWSATPPATNHLGRNWSFLEGVMDAKRMTDLWNRAIGIGKCKQFSADLSRRDEILADLSRGDEILGTPRRKRPAHRRAELP
jgi:hypothetical protein